MRTNGRRIVLFLLASGFARPISGSTRNSESDTSIGDRPFAGYYAPCGEASGADCRAGLECVTFGDHLTGLCLPPCMSDGECPSTRGRATCGVALTDGTSACAVDCSVARCPFGTTCGESDGRRVCADW
jgi:hypothetical protein